MAAKTVSEKVKSAPKELARRGLESGVDRLRGQLRDTAQRGQRDAYGGDTLANQLRREYGVSLLLSPTRQQMEEADVLVLFAARTDLRRRDPAVLRLYDEAAPLPPLLLPPVLEGQMPPGLCRPQLLAVLVESGVLRPGQITVGTAES